MAKLPNKPPHKLEAPKPNLIALHEDAMIIARTACDNANDEIYSHMWAIYRDIQFTSLRSAGIAKRFANCLNAIVGWHNSKNKKSKAKEAEHFAHLKYEHMENKKSGWKAKHRLFKAYQKLVALRKLLGLDLEPAYQPDLFDKK